MLEKVRSRTTRTERLLILAGVVRDAVHNPHVQRFASIACSSTVSKRECAWRILWFVQSRPYVSSPAGQWIERDLAQTVATGGECGALATLVCACAELNGIPWQLVWRSYPDGAQHISAKLAPEGAWLWADPTVRGASLGEDPNAAALRLRSPRGKRSKASP